MTSPTKTHSAEPRANDGDRAERALALTLADVRGLSRLAFEATLGVTNVVEQMHRTVGDLAAPLGRARPPQTRGLTGAVYRAVRGTTRLLSSGVDTSLRLIEPKASSTRLSPRREAMLAVINGLWGDHLAATDNPLAIPMRLRMHGQPVEMTREGVLRSMSTAQTRSQSQSKSALQPKSQSQSQGKAQAEAPAQPRRRIAVLIHGLCMNDLQWHRPGRPRAHHHGQVLADELGYATLDLHYNSGRHVSENGEDLARLLQALIDAWPVPVDELVLLGHSMGGLVARSACHVAQVRGLAWRRHLTRMVFLGTPHHGAVMERGGHWVDTLLAVSPYAAPFARLGKARSAGITDLRFGNVQHADWHGRDAYEQRRDDRVPTPLPERVQVFALAATTAAQPRGLRHAVVGDGLVSLASAWGEHRDPRYALHLPASHRALITRASHWDLLRHPEAVEALRRWLA